MLYLSVQSQPLPPSDKIHHISAANPLTFIHYIIRRLKCIFVRPFRTVRRRLFTRIFSSGNGYTISIQHFQQSFQQQKAALIGHADGFLTKSANCAHGKELKTNFEKPFT
jgi:hypothetical protein